jgi:hypothetical protein
MSDVSAAKRAWIERVLGFQFPPQPTAAGSGREWQAARRAWDAAIQTVDRQISALQSVLRGSGDPELIEIAEFGLNAVTGDHKARLTALLTELGDGNLAVMERSGGKARALLAEFRTHIENDPRVAACDGNPTKVSVSIRATLAPALAALHAALEPAQVH